MKFLLTMICAACALPTLAQDPVTVGKGDHTFTWTSGWAPDALGSTHGGIVVDKAGNIYCAMDSDKAIAVFSPDGKILRQFDKAFRGCHGLAINEEDGEEFIYAAHLAKQSAVKFKLDGTVVWTIKGLPEEAGVPANRYKPTGIAVGPNGDIYVVDGYGSNHVFQWDKDQTFIRKFGERGKGDGQFTTCHGITLDSRGETPLLLIADRENRRLQHFDLDGKFVAIVTTDLRRPCSMSIHGEFVAIAELAGRVTILNGKNEHVSYPGDNPNPKQHANFGVPPDQWVEGAFTAPHGISYDNDGNIIVMDWNRSGRINKLVKK